MDKQTRNNIADLFKFGSIWLGLWSIVIMFIASLFWR